MKRIIFSLLFILSLINVNKVNAQSGMNYSIGFGIGYSYVHDNFSKINNDVCNLFEVDCTILGIYGGFAFGERTISHDHDWAGNTFSEKISTYVWKIGPSFRIGYTYALIISPYIGMLIKSYGEYYSPNYYYYDCYNNYYYNYEYCVHEHPYNTSFIYGGKVSLKLDLVEIGAHVSNKEIGINVGIIL